MTGRPHTNPPVGAGGGGKRTGFLRPAPSSFVFRHEAFVHKNSGEGCGTIQTPATGQSGFGPTGRLPLLKGRKTKPLSNF